MNIHTSTPSVHGAQAPLDQSILQGGARALEGILPQGTPPKLFGCIENTVRDAFNQHGISAFAMPRDAAMAHEAGHAIVGTHEGVLYRSVSIESRSVPGFGMAWGGWCNADVGWTSGPDTTAQSDLSRARIIIAGLAAEALTGKDNPGSSIDERALTTALVSNAANKLAKQNLSDAEFLAYAEQLGDEQVWNATIAILRNNEEPFQQLVNELDQREKVKGSKLRNILAKVRRIPAWT
jgi:hypothetical protein